MEKILIVEDDTSIRTGLVDLLEGEGYSVSSARNGREAVKIWNDRKPDLILLDIMMPDKSGYDVCREIRKTDTETRILMLTARGEEVDKVIGLELGADDYIVKPFGVRELLARVRAGLRRRKPVSGKKPSDFSFGGYTVYPARMQARKDDAVIELSKREVDLLVLLKEHANEVVDRNTLLDRVWGIQYTGTTRTLDQHIANLRRKIEADPANPRLIHTVHGTGYRYWEE